MVFGVLFGEKIVIIFLIKFARGVLCDFLAYRVLLKLETANFYNVGAKVDLIEF